MLPSTALKDVSLLWWWLLTRWLEARTGVQLFPEFGEEELKALPHSVLSEVPFNTKNLREF